MVIILDTPFSLGDLSAEKFPHVYVTNLNINGPAATVMVQWEVGTMHAGNAWHPTPANTSTQFSLQGEELVPFFYAKPDGSDTSLWDQIEAIVYQQIQHRFPRYSGKLGAGFDDAAEPAATESTASEPSATASTESTAPATDAK